MENIKRLFYAYDNKYPFGEMPEVKSALDDLNRFLEKNMTREQFHDAEALSSELCIRSEMQGFVYGFQFAIRVSAECWADVSSRR